jgi:alpha-1,6-mannosyltransferase
MNPGKTPDSPPGKGLAAIAIAAFAGYAAVLVRDGFWRLSHPSPDGRLGPSGLEGFHLARGILNVCFLIVLAAYVIWLLRSTEDSSTFRGLLKKALVFLALGLVAYPSTTDVYGYLHYGAMGLRGVNPYLTPAGSIPIPEMPLQSDWRQTSTYGPLTQLLFMIAVIPAKVSPVLAVYGFKLLCLIAHVVNAFLVWRMLGAGRLRSKLTMAYLINPSLLSMHVAEAHVDVFLCSATILLVGCILSGRYVEASLAAWAGVLTKTLPILWLPLLASFMLRRRAWKSLGWSGLASVAIVAVLAATLLPTVEAWRSLFNPASRGMEARSIHHLASLVLEHAVKLAPAARAAILSQAALLCTGGFGLYYLWAFLKPHFGRMSSDAALVADLGWVTLALLLAATPWMMPWYPTILVPLGILSGAPFLGLCSLVFSLSAGVVYGDGAGRTMISILTTLVTIVPVLGALVWRRRLSEMAAGWLSRAQEGAGRQTLV